MAYRHGFRVPELIDVRLEEIDLRTAQMQVRQLTGSLSAKHTVEGDELQGPQRGKNSISFSVIQFSARELT